MSETPPHPAEPEPDVPTEFRAPPEPDVPTEFRAPTEPDVPTESRVPQHRLDPDLAAAAAGAPASPPPPPAIDTRPYRWMIGIFGLVLVIAISVYQFARNGVGSPGVAVGKRLHYFVAPLATSPLNLDANAAPRCDPADPNPQGLNVCGRTPLVLAFFVTGSGTCRREVDTLQAVSGQFSPSAVQFAAVAVHGSHSSTAAVVRSHHWTIPVAYDRDGAIGDLYGVEICPMVELAYPGGIVADRLIGERWLQSSALSARVRALVGTKSVMGAGRRASPGR